MFYFKSPKMLSWSNDMTLLEIKFFNLTASIFGENREIPVFVPNSKIAIITIGLDFWKAAKRATECLDLREFKSLEGERFPVCTKQCELVDGGYLVYLNNDIANELINETPVLKNLIDILVEEVAKGE